MNQKMTKQLFLSQLHYINFLNKNGFHSPAIIHTINNDMYTYILDYKKRWVILFDFVDKLTFPDLTDIQNVLSFAEYVGNLHLTSKRNQKESYWYYQPISEEKRKLKDLSKFIVKTKRHFLDGLIKLKQANTNSYQKLSSKLKFATLLNDLSEENFYINNEDYTFLDWNMASRGYFADEIAWIITWFFIKSNNIKNLSVFLKRYLEIFSLNKED